MYFQRFLLLMPMLVCFSQQRSLLFETGKLRAKNVILRYINTDATDAKIWGAMTIYNDDLYSAKANVGKTIYRRRNYGKESESDSEEVVVSMSETVYQILNTDDANLPLFVVTQGCLLWLAPSPTIISRWAGIRCDNIADDAVDHPNFRKDRPIFVSGFKMAAISPNYVYALGFPDKTLIHVMGIDTSVTHSYKVFGHENKSIAAIEYGQPYLYFSLVDAENYHIGKILEGRLWGPPTQNSPSSLVQDLLYDRSRLLRLSPSFNIEGPLASVLLPNLTQTRYLTGGYLLIMGFTSHQINGLSTSENVSVIRVLNVTSKEVTSLCWEDVNWEQYTRINDNYSDCGVNIPLSERFQVLKYKPGSMILYIHSTILDYAGQPKTVSHSWEFRYGPDNIGFVPNSAATRTTIITAICNSESESIWIYVSLAAALLLVAGDGTFL